MGVLILQRYIYASNSKGENKVNIQNIRIPIYTRLLHYTAYTFRGRKISKHLTNGYIKVDKNEGEQRINWKI